MPRREKEFSVFQTNLQMIKRQKRNKHVTTVTVMEQNKMDIDSQTTQEAVVVVAVEVVEVETRETATATTKGIKQQQQLLVRNNRLGTHSSTGGQIRKQGKKQGKEQRNQQGAKMVTEHEKENR